VEGETPGADIFIAVVFVVVVVVVVEGDGADFLVCCQRARGNSKGTS